MILVLLGTQHNEFTRLLKKIENLITERFITEDVIVQAGFTKFKTDKMKVLDMIPKEELNELIKKADLVITHGGVGSIITALEQGKKVIAVPRLSKFGEHVNDHQKQICEVFDKKQFLIGVQDAENLDVAINKSKNFIPKKYESDNQKMLDIISNFIDNI